MTRRKKALLAALLVTVVFTGLLVWPPGRYDINRVEHSLRDLEQPYRSVSTSFSLDGGSVSIVIVDRERRVLRLAVPAATDGSDHKQLFVKAGYDSKKSFSEVEFTEDTRRMLASIIEEHQTGHLSDKVALIAVRGAPKDYAAAALLQLQRPIR